MAKLGFVLFLIVVSVCLSATVNGLNDGMVGRRTKSEVKSPNSGSLKFKAVVEAETQVVSGTKYYPKIATSASNELPKTFDMVVVFKPWENYKELLNFTPSPSL